MERAGHLVSYSSNSAWKRGWSRRGAPSESPSSDWENHEKLGSFLLGAVGGEEGG